MKVLKIRNLLLVCLCGLITTTWADEDPDFFLRQVKDGEDAFYNLPEIDVDIPNAEDDDGSFCGKILSNSRFIDFTLFFKAAIIPSTRTIRKLKSATIWSKFF